MSLETLMNQSGCINTACINPQPTTTEKIKKKPGRKPKPASPALRKAQNRAAQRAFRERKEKHLNTLEIAYKQLKEQRDKLSIENEQLKTDQEILRSENWYLKGIVTTLQFVCFQHNLTIPLHAPFINEDVLSVLTQSMPESTSAYIRVNASNKLPIPSNIFSAAKNTMKQKDRYLSTNSYYVTKEGVHAIPNTTADVQPSTAQNNNNSSQGISLQSVDSFHQYPSILVNDYSSECSQPSKGLYVPPLSPGSVDNDSEHQSKCSFVTNDSTVNSTVNSAVNNTTNINHNLTDVVNEDARASNLAAIQNLRLRIKIQTDCAGRFMAPFAIKPTILQLLIPHDTRIDLIPASPMRDRMILYRDQFDLDDCLTLLLEKATFHGGDPALSANWELPAEFYDKYWFLTSDYNLRHTAKYWRKLQGFDSQQPDINMPHLESVSPKSHHEILTSDFTNFIHQINHTKAAISAAAAAANSLHENQSSYAPNNNNGTSSDEIEPIRLTNGNTFSSFTPKPQQPTPSPQLVQQNEKPFVFKQNKLPRYHPYQKKQMNETPTESPEQLLEAIKLTSPSQLKLPPIICNPWDTLLSNAQNQNLS